MNGARKAGGERGADLGAAQRLPGLALPNGLDLLRVVVGVLVAGAVATTPPALGVCHAGFHASVDLTRSLQSCDRVGHRVAEQVPGDCAMVAAHYNQL